VGDQKGQEKGQLFAVNPVMPGNGFPDVASIQSPIEVEESGNRV
jgi:hypothetical protein